MKYIVTKDEDGKEEIFIFPKSVNHDCMMEVLQRIRDQSYGRWNRVYREPVSAGFVSGGVCSGHSETLKLQSRGSIDSGLIS